MKGDDAVFIVGLLTLFICLYIVAKYHALAFWWWSEVMDYSQYILDYEAENKRLPGRQRVLRFLNFVQTKNVPISDWINTFYETLSREAGKCYTSTWSWRKCNTETGTWKRDSSTKNWWTQEQTRRGKEAYKTR